MESEPEHGPHPLTIKRGFVSEPNQQRVRSPQMAHSLATCPPSVKIGKTLFTGLETFLACSEREGEVLPTDVVGSHKRVAAANKISIQDSQS